MVELIALYLAGLSFFFSGISGLSDNLRQLSGQRFRQMLARATQHPLIAGLLGAAMGAVTQSASVVAFILAGMTVSGLLSLQRALLVLACSNIGTALLVFIAALDLHLPILFLIGMSGLILAFKLFNKFRPGFAALLSIGLVFFGLDMMKQVFQPLSSAPSLAGIPKFFDYWPDAAFFLGMLLRAGIHSSSAVAAITITISKGGTLGEFPAMMSIAGLGAGAAVATSLLSSNLRGLPRQIATYQMLGNVGAAVLLASLLMIERYTGVPLLLALLHRMSPSSAGRIAYMYLVFNLAIAALSIANLRWMPAWLVRICPPTPEQDLSRPMYLQVEALHSPETALNLVALEQMRMIRVLPKYMEAAREDKTIPLKSLHKAAGELSEQIAEFLEALLRLPIATDLAAQVISFQRKGETLRALEENMFLFSETLQGQETRPGIASRLVEGLDTIVLTAMDALQTKDESDVNLLMQLTEDRGGMMEKLRARLSLSEGQDVGNIAAQHYATTLFERNIWLLRQLALWIREDAHEI